MARAEQPIKLIDLANAIEGSLEGELDLVVAGVSPLGSAGADELSFLSNQRYAEAARATNALALLVNEGTDPVGLPPNLVFVRNVPEALATALALLFPNKVPLTGIHHTAVIADGCDLAADVSIGPYCVIGSGCRLGERVSLGSNVVLGRGCSIGADTVIHSTVVFYDRVSVGKRCVLHAGAVLGADGFGYASATGLPTKLPQVGTVVLGDDVEVGANSTIDRATLEETRVGSSTKIDNLVQVGHNVMVGEGCLLCGQSGIAGSAVLGDHVVLAGQAGVSGHLEIGDRVQVAAKSAVLQTTKTGAKVAGIPAMPIRQWQRQAAALKRLGQLHRRITALERSRGTLGDPVGEEEPGAATSGGDRK